MRPLLHSQPAWIAALALLGISGQAQAEIAVLRNGTTLNVDAWARADAEVHLKLRGGGEVAVPRALLAGIVPDEVVEEIARQAPARAGDLDSLLREAAARHGLDTSLVRAVVSVESAFRADAVSPKGAQGLMQLMPATAAALGVKDAFDPEQNLEGGSRHLAALLQGYGGDLKRALAAYNAGAGAVARHGGVPPFRETKDYVARVLDKYRGER